MDSINSKKYYDYVYSKVRSNSTINIFFPTGIQKEAINYIISEYQKGKRSDIISNDLRNLFSNIQESDFKCIIQTICSIASSAKTKFKSEALGISWYIWRTSKDQRVRSSHDIMDDVLVNFNAPPSPESLVNEDSIGEYNAGESFICRCYPEPVVRLNFINWPHKVYYNGTIQLMTQKQFEEIM